MQWPRWSELSVSIVALAAVLGAGYAVGGARSETGVGHLTVTARGTTWVAPDMARVNVGATETAQTSKEAMANLGQVAKAVLTAVEKQGIAASDVQTGNLNLGDNWVNGHRSGYQATEQFTVTVRHLSAVEPVIAAATSAGANQLNNVSLDMSDPNAGQVKAVGAALQAAKKQALAEAKELGVRLGKVTGVDLQQSPGPQPVFAAEKLAASAPAPSPPVAAGNQQITVTVQVTYSFR